MTRERDLPKWVATMEPTDMAACLRALLDLRPLIGDPPALNGSPKLATIPEVVRLARVGAAFVLRREWIERICELLEAGSIETK